MHAIIEPMYREVYVYFQQAYIDLPDKIDEETILSAVIYVSDTDDTAVIYYNEHIHRVCFHVQDYTPWHCNQRLKNLIDTFYSKVKNYVEYNIDNFREETYIPRGA